MYLDYVEAPAYARSLAILSIAAGLLLCIEGYRIHRVGAFLSALFVVGDYVLAIISLGDESFTSDAAQYYTTFFVSGVVVGSLALLHAKASSTITGLCAGIELAELILGMAKYSGTLGLYVALLSMFAVVVAVVTVFTKKPGFVIATSVTGANVLIVGVRYFAFAAIYDEYRKRRVLSEKLNSAWWTTCAISIVIIFVAIPVQLLLTARNVNHDHIAQDDAQEQSSQQPPVYSAPQYDACYNHPYNNVQTPQQHHSRDGDDAKSSYVAGSHISRV